MKRFSQFLSIIILWPCLLLAQPGYKPAVTVNSKGDTLHGFIDYREWDSNPKSILFKPSNGAPVRLSASDISYFNIQVDHLDKYVSYIGPISTDNTIISQLSIGRDTSFRQDTVFLRVAQEGAKVVLFSYEDSKKKRFFIGESLTAKPVELVYRIYLNAIDENGTDRTVYETAFKGQLYDVALKAGVLTSALKKQIKNAEYKEDDIIRITGIINGVSATDAAKNNRTKPKGYAIALAVVGAVAVIAWFINDLSALHHH